ncbi:Flp family type IVb pilin [Candidatus Liberibacter africanus]|uniref:Flp/Fap pilin component n=1 Tax=Candidatus Liberibacter africanus PTSAPSY TaxID=1277257 RepID=A0A0G3I8H4_LIBAF|nr:hypothetical protein G293_01975 [Candidatus Liberibacter africanus PTSAPSY]
MNIIQKFLKDESGATSIEYGLLVSLIAVVIFSAVTKIGEVLKGDFKVVSNALQGQEHPRARIGDQSTSNSTPNKASNTPPKNNTKSNGKNNTKSNGKNNTKSNGKNNTKSNGKNNTKRGKKNR